MAPWIGIPVICSCQVSDGAFSTDLHIYYHQNFFNLRIGGEVIRLEKFLTYLLIGFIREFSQVTTRYYLSGTLFFYSDNAFLWILEVIGWTVFHTIFIVLLLFIRQSIGESRGSLTMDSIPSMVYAALMIYALIPLLNLVEIETFRGILSSSFSLSELVFFRGSDLVYKEPLYISSVLSAALILSIFSAEQEKVGHPVPLIFYLNLLLLIYFSVIGITYRVLYPLLTLSHSNLMIIVALILLVLTILSYNYLNKNVERPLQTFIIAFGVMDILLLVTIRPNLTYPILTLVSFIISNALFTGAIVLNRY